MSKIRFLGDANVLVALDPAGKIHERTPLAAEFNELVSRGGHQLLRHPAIGHDFERDGDPDRRAMREALVPKYVALEDPVPSPRPALLSIVGTAAFGSNDWVDDQQLAAVAGHAVDYLVTDDAGIHRKARRAALSDDQFRELPERVITLGDAIQLLRKLSDAPVVPPPSVRPLPGHALREEDPIFSSFVADYPEFKEWFREKVMRGARSSWVVDLEEDRYGAVCIIKPEEESGLKTLKICSFKVAEEARGRGFGELLLKATFDHARVNHFDQAYVDVFPHHEALITLFDAFGFEPDDQPTEREELRYRKRFLRAAKDVDLDDLAFHVAFGPPAARINAGRAYIVPIWPTYHAQLFPECETQQLLIPPGPFGNALRKAYLSSSRIGEPEPGSVVLFYRTHPDQYVRCIGVVEDAQRIEDPEEVSLFVGNRTVYTYDEIVDRCSGGPVLAIRFRQDRVLDVPIMVQELVREGVFERPPQSIMRARAEGIEWLRNRIAM